MKNNLKRLVATNPSYAEKALALDENQAKLTELHLTHKNFHKECGKKYFKAIEDSAKLTLADTHKRFKLVKNGKKITYKRFLELRKEYVELCKTISSRKISRRNVLKPSLIRAIEYNQHQAKINVVFTQLTTKQLSKEQISEQLERHTLITKEEFGLKWANIKRRSMIYKAIENCVPNTSGDTAIYLNFTDDPAKVDYHSETNKGETYSSRCTYRKTDLSVFVTLPNNWYTRVYKTGLTKIDGMLNISLSTPLKLNNELPDGLTVYAATWLVNSHGTNRSVKHGFIACYSDIHTVYFHGKTLSSAIKGVLRKQQIESVLNAKNLCASVIISKAKKCTDVIVTLADSKSLGHCQYGITDFCNRNNIDLSVPHPSLPLNELAEIAVSEPRHEVITLLAFKLKQYSNLTLSH